MIVFISAVFLYVFWGFGEGGGGTCHSLLYYKRLSALDEYSTSIVSPFGLVVSVALEGPRMCIFTRRRNG